MPEAAEEWNSATINQIGPRDGGAPEHLIDWPVMAEHMPRFRRCFEFAPPDIRDRYKLQLEADRQQYPEMPSAPRTMPPASSQPHAMPHMSKAAFGHESINL